MRYTRVSACSSAACGGGHACSHVTFDDIGRAFLRFAHGILGSVAPGHQLGFNDLRAIEVAGYLEAIAGRRPEPFNFRAGLRIQTLMEAIHESSRAAAWRDVP